MEPVGQLSEVEKLDLEPESQTDRKRWREWRFILFFYAFFIDYNWR